MGFIFCAICEKKIIINDASEVENFRVGVTLLCPNCDKQIMMAVVTRIIDDTSVPRTYRSMFEKYLKWMEKKNK